MRKKAFPLIPLVCMIMSAAGCFLFNKQEPPDNADYDHCYNPDDFEDFDGDYDQGPQTAYDSFPRDQRPVGIGGGGAMSSFSMSPYSDLWFVGTDMGTLFRSADRGATWQSISHTETIYSSDLPNAPNAIGFCRDPAYLFFASAGLNPQISTDSGVHWSAMSGFPLPAGERIRYWGNDHFNENILFAGTSDGLYKSSTKGSSWTRIEGISGEAKGTYIDYSTADGRVYHATSSLIYRSTDGGDTFSIYYRPPKNRHIRDFTGGRDRYHRTLAFIDDDPAAGPSGEIGASTARGYVWVQRDGGAFIRLAQHAGDFIEMAENDSQTIYVTGGDDWPEGFGTKVWVSENAGETWTLRFHQLNPDTWEVWPASNFKYGAVGLDIGWWDGGYYKFNVNKRNSNEAGGTENFFLHVTRDKGVHWESPYTEFADTGERTAGKKWRSNGLEVTTAMALDFHPNNNLLAYAGFTDIRGMVSEDGAQTFRFYRFDYTCTNDFAFIPGELNTVYAAAARDGNYPYIWFGNVIVQSGGIFKSTDTGRTWTRFTPDNADFNRQFLSVEYSPIDHYLYAGSQSLGIARCSDLNAGGDWEYINTGIPGGTGRIISKIQIDSANGNVYILLAGDSPQYTNREYTGVYFLDLAGGSDTWQLLRTNVHRPPDVEPQYLMWWYPTSFAVDFTSPFVAGTTRRSVIWLSDQEVQGCWMASGIWKTTNGGEDWSRQTQYTLPFSITIDSTNANRIYIGGLREPEWGIGGPLYTTDGGNSWHNNDELPQQVNLRRVVEDPADSAKLYYLYHGNAIVHADKP